MPGEEFDPHSVKDISEGDWEAVLERFTQDMDPWAIDIVTLADRYKSYIERLERFDLELPGRVILIGAVLLRMKAEVLRAEHDDEAQEAEEELDEMFGDAEEWAEPQDEQQLRIPEAVPQPPVKKRGTRKVTLDELTAALEDAMAIEERRGARQEERREVEDFGVEVEENDISDRLDSLLDTVRSVLQRGRDAVTFSQLVEEDRQDQIETFVHLMHLETEERVRCIQEEFLGEIEVELLEDN